MVARGNNDAVVCLVRRQCEIFARGDLPTGTERQAQHTTTTARYSQRNKATQSAN